MFHGALERTMYEETIRAIEGHLATGYCSQLKPLTSSPLLVLMVMVMEEEKKKIGGGRDREKKLQYDHSYLGQAPLRREQCVTKTRRTYFAN
jgi:hypothetical protein